MKKEPPIPSKGLCINGFPCRMSDCRFWNMVHHECKIVLGLDKIISETEITKTAEKKKKQ